jgi:CBS domain containing-hemolysin-like protein
MIPLIFTVIILLAGSAFCSSTEAALFSVTESKIESLEKNSSVKSLLKLKKNISSSVGTIVILNNLFNIVGTLIAGVFAAQFFNQQWQIGLFSLALTVAVILFGEIFPKNFGQYYALNYALLTAEVISFFVWFFTPAIIILNFLSNLLFKEKEDHISEEEIKVLLRKGRDSNSIEHDESKLILNVFNMNDKTANDIMTPRINIDALEKDLTLVEQLKVIENSPHSRLPVYDGDFDKIVGYVIVRDALEAITKNEGQVASGEFSQEIVRIKETTRVDSLLLMFQKRREHIAIVVDEFGGTSGLVTLEDVLEEIVGEIVDERDEVVDMRSRGLLKSSRLT